MGIENVNSSPGGEDLTSAYNDPARVKVIEKASELAGFIRGKVTGEGNNCFIQSLLQVIHYTNRTKAIDPQKVREEAAIWEQILRYEAVVNGFERNGHLGVTYGKEDQDPANSPYDLHKTDGTGDNNFRHQLRLNLDNHVLTIYKYNEATGKLEAADIVKGINAGKNGKLVEIEMLYDRMHFDPLFAKKNKSDSKSAENMKEIFNLTLSKIVRALDVWRNSETVIDDEMYRGGGLEDNLPEGKKVSFKFGSKKPVPIIPKKTVFQDLIKTVPKIDPEIHNAQKKTASSLYIPSFVPFREQTQEIEEKDPEILLDEACKKEGFKRGRIEKIDPSLAFLYSLKLSSDYVEGIKDKDIEDWNDLNKWENAVKKENNDYFQHGVSRKIEVQWAYYSPNEIKIENVKFGQFLDPSKREDREATIINMVKSRKYGKYKWSPLFPDGNKDQQKKMREKVLTYYDQQERTKSACKKEMFKVKKTMDYPEESFLLSIRTALEHEHVFFSQLRKYWATSLRKEAELSEFNKYTLIGVDNLNGDFLKSIEKELGDYKLNIKRCNDDKEPKLEVLKVVNDKGSKEINILSLGENRFAALFQDNDTKLPKENDNKYFQLKNLDEQSLPIKKPVNAMEEKDFETENEIIAQDNLQEEFADQKDAAPQTSTIERSRKDDALQNSKISQDGSKKRTRTDDDKNPQPEKMVKTSELQEEKVVKDADIVKTPLIPNENTPSLYNDVTDKKLPEGKKLSIKFNSKKPALIPKKSIFQDILKTAPKIDPEMSNVQNKEIAPVPLIPQVIDIKSVLDNVKKFAQVAFIPKQDPESIIDDVCKKEGFTRGHIQEQSGNRSYLYSVLIVKNHADGIMHNDLKKFENSIKNEELKYYTNGNSHFVVVHWSFYSTNEIGIERVEKGYRANNDSKIVHVIKSLRPDGFHKWRPLFPDENKDQEKIVREKVLAFYEQQERIKKASEEEMFEIHKVSELRDDSFLLSIQAALEKEKYHYFITKSRWLMNLRKEAENCGISRSTFINIDNLNGDFLKVIEKELGQFKLKIKSCNVGENKPKLEDLKIVNGKGSKEIDILSLGENGYAALFPHPDKKLYEVRTQKAAALQTNTIESSLKDDALQNGNISQDGLKKRIRTDDDKNLHIEKKVKTSELQEEKTANNADIVKTTLIRDENNPALYNAVTDKNLAEGKKLLFKFDGKKPASIIPKQSIFQDVLKTEPKIDPERSNAQKNEITPALFIPKQDPESIIDEVCKKEGFTRGYYPQEEKLDRTFLYSFKIVVDALNGKKHDDLEKWEKSVQNKNEGYLVKGKKTLIYVNWFYSSANEMKIKNVVFGEFANKESPIVHVMKIKTGDKYKWIPIFPNTDKGQQEIIRNKVLKFYEQQVRIKEACKNEMFEIKLPSGDIDESFLCSLHLAMWRQTHNVILLNDWVTKIRDAAERSGISRSKIIGIDNLNGNFLKELENALGECKLTIKRCNDSRPELENIKTVNDRGSKEIYLLNSGDGDFVVLLPDYKRRLNKEKDNPKEDVRKSQESNQKLNEMIGYVCKKEGFTQGSIIEGANLERSFYLSMKLAIDALDGKMHNDLEKWEKSVKFEKNSYLSQGRVFLIIVRWAYLSTSEMKIKSVEFGSKADRKSQIIHIIKISTGEKYKWIPIFPNRDKDQQETIRNKVLTFYEQQERIKDACKNEMFEIKMPPGSIEERFICSLHSAIMHQTNIKIPLLNAWVTEIRDAAERSGISKSKIIGMEDLNGDFLKEIENGLGECKLIIKRCNDVESRRPELENIKIVNDRGSKELFILNIGEDDFVVLKPEPKRKPQKEIIAQKYLQENITDKKGAAPKINLIESLQKNDALKSPKSSQKIEEMTDNTPKNTETPNLTQDDSKKRTRPDDDKNHQPEKKVKTIELQEEQAPVNVMDDKIQENSSLSSGINKGFKIGKAITEKLINSIEEKLGFVRDEQRFAESEIVPPLEDALPKDKMPDVKGSPSRVPSVAASKHSSQKDEVKKTQESNQKLNEIDEALKEKKLTRGLVNNDKKNSLFYSIRAVLEKAEGIESNEGDIEKWVHNVREIAEKNFGFTEESNLHCDISNKKEKNSAEQLRQLMVKALNEYKLRVWSNTFDPDFGNELVFKVIAGEHSKNSKKEINIFDDGNYHYAPLFADNNSVVSSSTDKEIPFVSAINKAVENYVRSQERDQKLNEIIDEVSKTTELHDFSQDDSKKRTRTDENGNPQLEKKQIISELQEEQTQIISDKFPEEDGEVKENKSISSDINKAVQIGKAITEKLINSVTEKVWAARDEHHFDDPKIVPLLEKALQDAKFTRGTASGEGNNCLLYSLKKTIDNAEGIRSTQDEVRKWVDDLRKVAMDCDFGKNEFLGITDISGETPDKKFRTKLAERVLNEYVLETWALNTQTKELEWLNSLPGVNSNEKSKILYVYFNDGRNHYEPLFAIENRERSGIVKHYENTEEIGQKIKEKGFTRAKAEGKNIENSSFLYSVKEALDKIQLHKSNQDEIEKWVDDLRVKAAKCGFKENDNIHVNDFTQDDHENKKASELREIMEGILGEYKLRIMEFDLNNKIVNEAQTVIGKEYAEKAESKTLYLFVNIVGGKYHYDPLCKNDDLQKDKEIQSKVGSDKEYNKTGSYEEHNKTSSDKNESDKFSEVHGSPSRTPAFVVSEHGSQKDAIKSQESNEKLNEIDESHGPVNINEEKGLWADVKAILEKAEKAAVIESKKLEKLVNKIDEIFVAKSKEKENLSVNPVASQNSDVGESQVGSNKESNNAGSNIESNNAGSNKESNNAGSNIESNNAGSNKKSNSTSSNKLSKDDDDKYTGVLQSQSITTDFDESQGGSGNKLSKDGHDKVKKDSDVRNYFMKPVSKSESESKDGKLSRQNTIGSQSITPSVNVSRAGSDKKYKDAGSAKENNDPGSVIKSSKDDNDNSADVQSTISSRMLVPIAVKVKRIIESIVSLQEIQRIIDGKIVGANVKDIKNKRKADEKALNIKNDCYQYLLWKNFKTVNKILIRNYYALTKVNMDIKKFKKENPGKIIPKTLINKRVKIAEDLRILSNEIGQNVEKYLKENGNLAIVNDVDKSIKNIRDGLNKACTELISFAYLKDDGYWTQIGINLGAGDVYGGLKKEINDKKKNILKNIIEIKNLNYRIELANAMIKEISAINRQKVRTRVHPSDCELRFCWDQKLALYDEYIYYCKKMSRALHDNQELDKEEEREKIEIENRISELTLQREANLKNHLKFLLELLGKYGSVYDNTFKNIDYNQKVKEDEEKNYSDFIKFMISITSNIYALSNELDLNKDETIDYIKRLEYYNKHAFILQNYIWEKCKNNNINKSADALEKEHVLNEMMRYAYSQENLITWLKNNSKDGIVYDPNSVKQIGNQPTVKSYFNSKNQLKINTKEPEDRLKDLKTEIDELKKEKIKVLNESINFFKKSKLEKFEKCRRICNALNEKKSLIEDQNEIKKIEKELVTYTNNLKTEMKKLGGKGVALKNSLEEISSRPVYKIAKDGNPGHVRMIENSRTRDHNEVVDLRTIYTREEAGINKRGTLVEHLPTQINYKNEEHYFGSFLHRDEFPYNSFKEGGSYDAYVEWVLAKDNMEAGNEIEQFFSNYAIKEYEEFEVEIVKYSKYTEIDEMPGIEIIREMQKANEEEKAVKEEKEKEKWKLNSSTAGKESRDPARFDETSKACEEAGFTRGKASGEGNNRFITSLIGAIHNVKGTKEYGRKKALKDYSEWKEILRDEAVVSSFQSTSSLGLNLKSDNTPLRKLIQKKLDNYVLTIWRYNETDGKLEMADRVEGDNTKNNERAVEIYMLFDENLFDPLLLKNTLQNSAGSKIKKQGKNGSKNPNIQNNDFKGGDPSLENIDPARERAIKQASENAGFIRGHAPGTGNNCFIQSLLQGIHHANGMEASEPQKAHEEAAIWEAVLRNEAVVNGFERTGYLGVSDLTDGTPDKKFREQLIKNLDNYVLHIWNYNEQRSRLEIVDIVKGEKADNGGAQVEINMLFDINHFDPLFPKDNQAKKVEENRILDVNQDDPAKNTEVKDLNSLLGLIIQLLDLKTETVLPMEVKKNAENYFINGCLWKTNGKSIEMAIDDNIKVSRALIVVNDELKKKRFEFGKNENREKIIKEYLKYYPDKRTRIESILKDGVELEILSDEVVKKIEEKQNMIDKVHIRVSYEVSIYKNFKLFQDIAKKFTSGRNEKTIQNKLLLIIGNMAKVEVSEDFSPRIVKALTDYKPDGSVNENIKDLKASIEEYDRIKLLLMNLAIHFQEEFGYYDFRDGRKGLHVTLEQYDKYRKKIEIIEKTREKIDSEIETYQKRMKKDGVPGDFERLENEINNLLTVSSLDKLPAEDKIFLDNYIKKSGLRGQKVRVAQQYNRYFGIIDGDLKADLDKRIKTFENFQSELTRETGQKRIHIEGRQSDAAGDIEKRGYCSRILDAVKSDIGSYNGFLKDMELEQACANEGLRRAFTPGNDNNCVLESITKTINRANGSDKENQRKAFEESALWQSILRAEAVELGFREKQGFVLINDPRVLSAYALKFIELNDLTNNRHAKFMELLRLNLDNYILNVWKYNPENKKLMAITEIKGRNAEKEGIVPVRINILGNPGHAEPMFPDENIDWNIIQGTDKKEADVTALNEEDDITASNHNNEITGLKGKRKLSEFDIRRRNY